MITDDFKCRNSSCWLGDSVTQYGDCLEALTSAYGLHQLIETEAHQLQNSATCIDLVFTNQPHLVMDSVVHSSLCSMCHHQIVFV